MRFYLERKEPLLIDNSSLTRKSRARYLAEAKHFHAKVGCIFLNTSVTALLERNRMRAPEFQVPEQVISSLFAAQEPPREDEGFEAIRLNES
jgi:predicted kinase